MQLWTRRPSSFRIDAIDLWVDPKQGQYWKDEGKNFRYREVAPMLWELVKTDQFLWCCTLPRMFIRATEEVDLVEWEINTPPAKVIAYISSPVWENLVWSRSNSWDGLIINHTVTLGHKDILASCPSPLPPDCLICHGQLPPLHTREQLEKAAELLRNPPLFDPAYDFDDNG